jgi:hypothetical protein
MSSKDYPKYDKRYLITLNLYNHDIPFKKPSSGKLETLKDYNDFIVKNNDLIKKIWSVEDDLIRIGGSLKDDFNTMDDVLNNILLKIITKKEQSGKFDKELFNDDFYNQPIKNFKSLFHN